jgi:hypothetical protein
MRLGRVHVAWIGRRKVNQTRATGQARGNEATRSERAKGESNGDSPKRTKTRWRRKRGETDGVGGKIRWEMGEEG